MYDEASENFLSRNFFEDSAQAGAALEKPAVSEETKRKKFETMEEGDLCIVGMDGFEIPWAPIFRIQHGPHCFIMEKGKKQKYFDPSYDTEDMNDKTGRKFDIEEVLFKSYSVTFAAKTDFPQKKAKIRGSFYEDIFRRQAEQVVLAHRKSLGCILEKCRRWIKRGGREMLFPAKLAEAMTVNRYMYRHFMKISRSVYEKRGLCSYCHPDLLTDCSAGCPALFGDYSENRAEYIEEEHEVEEFLFGAESMAKWRAVKNGFYKAAAGFSDKAFNESCGILSDIFEREIETARLMCGRQV